MKLKLHHNHRLAVNDHDLVVVDGMSGVNERGNVGVEQKISGGILCSLIALIENGLNLHSTLCVSQSLGHWSGCEGVFGQGLRISHFRVP